MRKNLSSSFIYRPRHDPDMLRDHQQSSTSLIIMLQKYILTLQYSQIVYSELRESYAHQQTSLSILRHTDTRDVCPVGEGQFLFYRLQTLKDTHHNHLHQLHYCILFFIVYLSGGHIMQESASQTLHTCPGFTIEFLEKKGLISSSFSKL